MKSNKCVILIPIYKEKMNCKEYMSISNTINLFNDKYDIFFMCNNELNTHNYNKLFNIKYKKYNYSNVQEYSSLLINSNFYKEFLNYDYILIAQHDAYIFNEKSLEYFINKQYPYIGAIFDICGIFINDNIEKIKEVNEIIENLYINNKTVKELSKYINIKNLFFGMNGGLSLRKTDLLYHLLKNKDFNNNLNEDYEICNIMCNLKLFDNILIKDIINFSYELRFNEIYKKYNIIPFGSHQTYSFFIENIIQQ